jgi:hypothetical protein
VSAEFSFRPEVKELYESDKDKLRDIARTMHDRYKSGKLATPVEDAARRAQYARELTDRVNEAGFACDVLWEWQTEKTDDDGYPLAQSPTVSDDPDDQNLYWVPQVIITGRTATLLDYDHDKQKFEVREGVYDGLKGVIDPNTGTLKEDAKRKDIY